MGGWQTSGSLTSRAWSVVKSNPYMLGFPVLGALLGGAALFGIGAAGLLMAGLTDPDNTGSGSPVGYAVAVVGVYLSVLATVFATGALTHCAYEELHGRDSSFGAGFTAALGRLPALAGWAAIQTAVGWLLSSVRGNGSNQNAIVAILRVIAASLLSVAWSLITFFVLPFIMLRGQGPVSAIKSSLALLRATWGTQLGGSVRIGGIMALVAILPGLLLVLGGGFLAATDKVVAGVPVLGIGAIWLLVGSVFLSAIRAVFSVALFSYADEGAALGPFDRSELAGAIKARP